MTGSVSVRVEQPSSAKPAAVYDVLMDVERWPEWMPTVSAASWEKHGVPDTGLGGVRRVGKGLNITRDHVIAGTRPNHHAYAASTPRWMLIQDYRGDIRIEDGEIGSLIVWTVTCTPRFAALSRVFESRLQSAYTRLAAALAREAEREESSKDREPRRANPRLPPMSDSAASVVRRFMATWPRFDVDEVIGFFSEDAVYTDGPRGTYSGTDEIRAEMETIVQLVPSTTADVKSLVASGGTVMVERVDVFDMMGQTFDVEIAGVFEVDDNGRISRWRDYYDMRSLEERVGAALAPSATEEK